MPSYMTTPKPAYELPDGDGRTSPSDGYRDAFLSMQGAYNECVKNGHDDDATLAAVLRQYMSGGSVPWSPAPWSPR